MANSASSSAPLPSGFPKPVTHITSHRDDGKAVIYSSNENPWNMMRNNSVGLCLGYATTGFPVDLNDEADLATYKTIAEGGKLGLVNPNGTVCRWVDLAPNAEPMMHRTQSLDYGVVLEGEVELELDDGSVTRMRKGDLAVQRATMHAWRNPSKTEWARILFVLQDCKPLLVGGARFKEELGTGTGELPASGNDN
ncbi:hypothetical protein B0A52_10324 [Exophiala mesophila]|uniref:Cupin type-2 domain-containing protein n=1 Tax=Exophiala mesophila TaxID=212818 RepID=A0A438MRS7_EXOME|nr:hypothetical protein B0A52_10324 [Exophiala mesophila]